MKRFLVLILASIGFCGGLAAQQNPADSPATKEDIKRYFDVMHSKEMLTKMMDAMAKPMHQMLHEQYMKDKDKLPPDFEARTQKTMDEYLKSFPWDEMIEAMAPVYQRHFTKGDVDALVAFYSTPTGQKLIREMPQITAETMQSVMPLMQKSIDGMTQRVQQEVAEMTKDQDSKSTNLPPQKNN